MSRRIATLILLGALAGCAVGPNFHSPAPPTATGYTPTPLPAAIGDGIVQHFASSAPVPEQWWTLFGSPAIDALVEEALKANPDLKAAEASLRQARAQLGVARAALMPTVDASYQAERTRASRTLSPPLNDDTLLYTLHTPQVSVSYPLDLFGGARRSVESTKAQTEAARFQYEAARLSIITNTIQAAIEEASLREQVSAADASVASAKELLTLFQRRQILGEAGLADVAAQRATLAQAEQGLLTLRKSLAQQQAALSVLLGREPSMPLPHSITIAELTLPGTLPVSLPADLVRQRPDIRTAEEALHSASADVGVAIAARLPNIMLSATGGNIATRFADLFTSGAGFWSLIGGVTQPIFHGGALLKQQRAAEAGLDKAKAQYRSTVLSAFQDVSNTLSALDYDSSALGAAEVSEQAAAQRLGYVCRQLDLGTAGTLDILNAQISYREAQSSLISARAARYADTVALFQALGGGWWNKAPVSSASDR